MNTDIRQVLGDRLDGLEREINLLINLRESERHVSNQCLVSSDSIKRIESQVSCSRSSSQKSRKSNIPVRVNRIAYHEKCVFRKPTRDVNYCYKPTQSSCNECHRPTKKLKLSITKSSTSASKNKEIIKYSSSKSETYFDKHHMSEEVIISGKCRSATKHNKQNQTIPIGTTTTVTSTNTKCECDNSSVTCNTEYCFVTRAEKSTETLRPKHKCTCTKKAEELMKRTNETIASLQSQIRTLNKDLQLLCNGRELLSRTLQVLKKKYCDIIHEQKYFKAENQMLRQQNLEMAKKLFDLQEYCDKTKVCQEKKCLKIIQENEELQSVLARAEDERTEMINLIKRQNEELVYVGSENKRLACQLEIESDLSMNYIASFEEKIKKVITLEQHSQRETKNLKCVVQSIQKSEHIKREQKEDELTLMRHECKALKKKLIHMKKQDQLRCTRIEKELHQFLNLLAKNEEIVENERNRILEIVQELSNVVFSHRSRINQLLRINKQQEGLLFSQCALIKKKEDELFLAAETIKTVNRKALILEKQIANLKLSTETVKSFSKAVATKKCGVDNIQNELIRTRSVLKDEKEKILIQEKIIQDQADTIKKLKQNITLHKGSAETACADVNNLLKQLQNERDAKEELLNEIKALEKHKDLLIEEIQNLKDQDDIGDCKDIKNKLVEQHELLSVLESEVAVKQRKWHEQFLILNKEKSKAIKVAQFATKKLIETINDFEEQTESQIDIHSKVMDIMNKSWGGSDISQCNNGSEFCISISSNDNTY